eukprot:5014788-Pyramimonas_sp.AAC.1
MGPKSHLLGQVAQRQPEVGDLRCSIKAVLLDLGLQRNCDRPEALGPALVVPSITAGHSMQSL